MLVHRIYCCSPVVLHKSGLPLDAAQITYWDVLGASNGIEAIASFHDDALRHYEFLAWEMVDEELPFDCNYAMQYIKNQHRRNSGDTNSKPRPVICPEVWFDGTTNSEDAMKAVRDLCKGIR